MSSNPSQILYSFFLTCLLFFILTITTNAQHYVMRVCNTASNYTQDDDGEYRFNLYETLNTLASNIARNGFNTTISGDVPYQVYGLLQCRGDVSYQVCRTCARISTMEILQQCPNNKEAVMFYDFCMLQYADHPIFSKPNLEIVVHLRNVQNTTTPDLFNRVLRELMSNLSSKAASDPSKFAIREAPFGDRGNLYGLVQCNRDLSETDCLRCLQAMYEFRTNTTRFQKSIGAQIWSTTCNIRYENYLFYEYSANAPSPVPPGVVDGNPSTRSNNTSSNHGAADASKENGTGSGTKKPLVIITISVILAIFVLGSGVCFIFREKIIQKVRKVLSEDRAHKEGGQDSPFYEVFTHGKRDYQGKKNDDLDLNLFDMDTIVKATYNFSDISLLGQGGFGCVYKGTLEDGKEIAVKRLSKNSRQGLEEFKNEVMLIARLQHRNLVRLLGLCAEGEEKILVYEYMENKSLDAFLFDKTLNHILDWPRRFNIIVGISRGLLYLHQDSRFRIIHRDLKTSNVLLDGEMNPKISDFGLARIFRGDDAETETKRVVGTYGYMSPEYAMDGIFSVKSDVFSFGVLVLEIISGKKNRGFFSSSEQLNLLGYAWKLWKEGKALQLIDETMKDSCLPNEALRCIHIGLLCVQENAKDRPTMPSVVLMLSTDTTKLQQPKQPGFSFGKSYLEINSSSTSKQGSCSANDVTCTNIEAR